MAKTKKKLTPKPQPKPKAAPVVDARPWRPTKEVSVMAWIEDAFGNVLLIKQARGKRCWSLPGGKVKARESMLSALKREVREETGLIVVIASPVDIFDRPKKSVVTILYRAILKRTAIRVRRNPEIETFGFRRELPDNVTPSARHFWNRAQLSFEPLSMI